MSSVVGLFDIVDRWIFPEWLSRLFGRGSAALGMSFSGTCLKVVTVGVTERP